MNIRRAFTTLLIAALPGVAQAAPAYLQANVAHDQDYVQQTVRNTRLIYPEKNADIARRAARINLKLHPAYEASYGYALDETLDVGLLSDYNQVPNGFTDFLPRARQMDYIGGAMLPDYFSVDAWPDTLLYHETAHSYQMDAKNNPVSRNLHRFFGNGFVILPWFTSPNVFESSFLLEGNAVLNESWHGNGGRLYSGRFLATTLMQARAGLLTPERLYNNHLYFDYGTHHYTLGGFYQYFLAQRYGLDKTNHYWLEHSKNWLWPFVTNRPTLKVFGKNFETLVGEWAQSLQARADKMATAKGEAVASSQFSAQINSDDDEIYFTVNESGREYPDLIIIDKHDRSVQRKTGTWLFGKVVKTPDGDYATQSSFNTNPWRIYIGLFDEAAFIKPGTRSHVTEGYLADGREVYFDIPSSWVRPQLYIGKEKFAETNSSVYIHGNDVYYFRQGSGDQYKQRSLYRNHEKLFTLNGFYGHVVGVDNNGVSFIANTENGSGLFRYRDGQFERLSPADNIIDARLLDAGAAVVNAVGSDAYEYRIIALRPVPQAPYEVKLTALENDPRHAKARVDETDGASKAGANLAGSAPYHALTDMHYSGIDLALGSDSEAGFLYNISANFGDPLGQNSLSLFASRNLNQYTLGGLSYQNGQYFLNYSLTAFHILDRPDPPAGATVRDQRENGGLALASIPFLQSGYYFGDLSASYFVDYQSNTRKPLSTQLTLANAKYFGVSMDINFLLKGAAYAVSDRGDHAWGGRLRYQQGLPREFFIAFNAQHSQSDAASSRDDRGIKINATEFDRLAGADPSSIVMPSIRNNPSYTKEADKLGGSIKKVFNFSRYYFTFPLSLRREKLYLGYNHYRLTGFSGRATTLDETTLGLTLDLLVLNKLPVPLSFEYIHNSDDNLANGETWRVRLGFAI